MHSGDKLTNQLTDKLTIDTPEQIALELPLAGIGSRFLALAFDSLLQFIITFLGFLVFLFTAPVTIGWLPQSLWAAIFILFLFTIYWGYFAVFEIMWKGQTPGKRHAGIRVIKASGRPINTFEAIARNLMRAVDGLPGMYATGVVTMLLNQQNRRLGDYVAGTVVVHEKPAEHMRPMVAEASGGTAPSDAVRKISANELVVIESYLHRRFELPVNVRSATSQQLVALVTNKTGIQPAPGQSNDDLLEQIVQQVRESARLR
ncbi:MAG: RDD family protein [Candidatus Korobacteraceae bacterium]